MKREIKFRAWNTEAKYMIQDPTSMGSIMRDHIRRSFDLNGKLIGENDVVMQFAGLKDKNGVEIFEDDIIKVSDPDRNHRIQRVVFKGGAFCGYSPKKNIKYTLLDILIRAHDIEVIGNVHENPEFLEAK